MTTPRQKGKPLLLIETLRVSKEQRKELNRAARKRKISRSQFVRDAALREARQVAA